MKKFEILRYLKRFSMLIFLLTMAGAAMIYLYAQGKQQYTASVVLKYTNDGIKDGYAPDGSELDVNEIYSSTVINLIRTGRCSLQDIRKLQRALPGMAAMPYFPVGKTRKIWYTGKKSGLWDFASFCAESKRRRGMRTYLVTGGAGFIGSN